MTDSAPSQRDDVGRPRLPRGAQQVSPRQVWPPVPIRTARLVLRESQRRDRPAFVELLGSAEAHTYLGGPMTPETLADLPEIPGRRPGVFVVEADGEMIGTVMLERRNLGPADRVRPAHGEADLGYLFLPRAWGNGYATEACEAALSWFATTCPGEPVVLVTQSANVPSMRLAAKLGFTEERRFHRFGAEQWFGVRTATPRWTPHPRRGLPVDSG